MSRGRGALPVRGDARLRIDITPCGTRGGRAPAGLLLRVALRAASALHRLRGHRVAGLDVLYLTTIGARSGRPRTVPLAWFRDGEPGWIVIGSFGGAARHPAWFLNLAAHPDRVWVEVAGQRVRVDPESLRGAERAARLAAIAERQPRYAGYQAKTDRELPVVRLVPAGPDQAA